ncbi:MAG: hypothetical protein AB2L11_00150 [Syntrophobacteraceae bacterium]
MKECKECDLAIYCFSESGTWIFRTKQEMEEKKAAMANCPLHHEVQQARTMAFQDSSKARQIN